MEEKFNIIRKYNFWDEKNLDFGFYRADKQIWDFKL